MKYCLCTVPILFVLLVPLQAETPAFIKIDHRNSRDFFGTGGVRSAAFSPDGKTIVAAYQDRIARIWDAESGKELDSFHHNDWVRQAVFSPDGKKILTCGNELVARIWDVESGWPLQRLVGHEKVAGPRGDLTWVHPAIFSPDGKKVLTAGADKTVRIWDAESGKELHKLEGHHDHVRVVLFTPDGKNVISASQDRSIRIWDVDSGKILHSLEGRICGYDTFKNDPTVLSPDGKRIVVRGRDGIPRIWDIESGRELLSLEGAANSATFSPDGKKIVTTSVKTARMTSEIARIWDAETGEELLQLRGDPNDRRDMRFHGGFKPIIRPDEVIEHDPWTIATVQFDYARFSPDGTKVFTTGNPHDRVVRVWDAKTGKELHVLGGHENGGTLRFDFSPDGKKLITLAGGWLVFIWDLERLPGPLVRQAIRHF